MNPQRLGSRYLLHDRLGQGAMGVVWRGQDLETGAWVAVKLLRPDYAASPAAVSRFVGERNALVRFRHPNVVNLRDMIVEGDRLALVMDLITGGDLDIFRQHSGGTLAPEVAARMTAQICEGLAAAHAAGIIHRDLKPSNVLLQGGQVKLADFGISRIAGEARRTTTGTVMGTPTYLAPEVINGAEPTEACDVYAVGITLYELLTGQPPFDGHVVAVMQAHLQREPDRISGIADPLWDLLAACLSKDPASRPTATDLARSLKALDEGAGSDGLGPGPAVGVRRQSPTRSIPLSSPHTTAEPAGQSRQTGQVPVPAQPAGYLQAPVPVQFQGPAQSSPPGQSPPPEQSPLPWQPPIPAQSPRATPPPMPPGGPGAGTGLGTGGLGAGPLAMPPDSGGWPRKRLLAAVAACVAIVVVAVTVYATAFSSKSTNSQTGGGLTRPPVGAITSGSFPSLRRPGAHHLHLGVHVGDPTPGTSASPGKPARHTGHPRSSSSSTPHTSSSPSPGKSPTSSPTNTSAPFGAWRCSNPVNIPAASGGASTLEACIRVFDGEVQIQGQLLGADVGEDEIQLALDSTNAANGALSNYTSPVCKTSTCTYTGTVHAPIGEWYVVAVVINGGAVEGASATSPTIDYTG